MPLCVHACMRVYMLVYVCVCMHACVCVCVYVHESACVCVQCKHTCVCVHVCLSVCMCVSASVQMCKVFLYIYVYVCMHMYNVHIVNGHSITYIHTYVVTLSWQVTTVLWVLPTVHHALRGGHVHPSMTLVVITNALWELTLLDCSLTVPNVPVEATVQRLGTYATY